MIEKIVKLVDRTNSTADGSWSCDLCDKKLGNGEKWFADAQRDIDICDKCYGHSNELITTCRADPSFRYTPRGLRLKFVDPSTINYGEPVFFDTFIRSILPESCKGWAREWKDLVRVPKDFVWMEWVRFTPWNKVDDHEIWTSFIVKCVKGQDMKVALLAKNNHNEISVYVCFATSDIFVEYRNDFWDQVKEQPEIVAKLSLLSDSQSRGVASITTTEFYSEFVWLTTVAALEKKKSEEN